MPPAQSSQLPTAERGEAEPHHPVVVAITFASHEAVLRGTVDEADGAVVTEEESLGDVAHRRATDIVVAAHREEQLMLAGGHPERLSLFLAPAEEAADLGSEDQQPSVIAPGQLVGCRHGKVSYYDIPRGEGSVPQRPRRRLPGDAGTRHRARHRRGVRGRPRRRG